MSPVAENRVTSWTRWSFGSGGITRGIIENAHYFVLVYYSQVLGLSPHLAGIALGIGLFVDAVTDPLIGYLSDNTRSRLGRRHPYLYASVVPLAASYFLLWHPHPSITTETGLFAYLIAVNCALNFSLTLFVVPAYSTIAEITEDYEERTRLLARLHAFMSVVGNGMSVAMYSLWLVETDQYPDGIMNVDGYKTAGIVGATLIAASILTFTVGLHRHIPRFQTHRAPAPVALKNFWIQVRDVLLNPSMRAVITSGALYWAGSGTYAALWVYIYSYFWELTSQQISLIVIPMAIGGFCLPPIVERLSHNREKKQVALFGLMSATIVNLLPILLRLLGWFPENGSATLFYILMGLGFFETWLFLVYDVSWRSMTADVTEQLEQETGRRNEGVISSAVTFASKCSYALGTFIAGLLLTAIAFPTQTAVAQVGEDVLFRLGMLYGPVIAAIFLAACYAISRYDISRSGFNETVAHLEAERDGEP